eukprot:2290394-Heterocapsa_arctica.AAC.1
MIFGLCLLARSTTRSRTSRSDRSQPVRRSTGGPATCPRSVHTLVMIAAPEQISQKSHRSARGCLKENVSCIVPSNGRRYGYLMILREFRSSTVASASMALVAGSM